MFMTGTDTEESYLEIFSLIDLFVITDINHTEKILSGMNIIFIIIIQRWQSGQKIGGFGFYCGFFAFRIRFPILITLIFEF